ncbi:MAG: DUF1156 domain-containing protein [Bryobacteraceae bacterium]
MSADKRLIEDYLPIEAISAEASREKSVRKGHISTLHIWWARRPLSACRAAVYGSLVPASRFVPNGGSDEKRKSLGRANSAKFVKGLCLYPGEPRTIHEAQRHILIAHAERLTQELTDWKAGNTSKPGWAEEFSFAGLEVTVEDIVAGNAPRPRVLDMFAGGGAIPLEALRLGAEAYALDLNPVAHIIQLCTLVYPQKYGRPDATVRGMTGPKNEAGETTWGGLAEEVRYWGNSVLKKVRAEIGDLYPPIPDPQLKGKKPALQHDWFKEHDCEYIPEGYLMPVAYLWTRTVKCKNPACGAKVPLVKQTWLCKKEGRYVAMRMIAPRDQKQVRFEVVEAKSEKGLGFDPEAFSEAGNATCPFCGAVADSEYVKSVGHDLGYGQQPMAIVCVRPGRQGKVYIDADSGVLGPTGLEDREQKIGARGNIPLLTEAIEANPRSFDVHRYGFLKWSQVFTAKQRVTLMAVAECLLNAWKEISSISGDAGRACGLYTATALSFSRLVTHHNAFAFIDSSRETIVGPWGDGKFPMSWDFAEANMFSDVTASYANALDWAVSVYQVISNQGEPAHVTRGDATAIALASESCDAVITDPPYYDSVSYSNLADAFYVWLKRTLVEQYPQHFASVLCPKKREVIAATYRHGGDKQKASTTYEDLMAAALKEAQRVLKPDGTIVVVYAHKTTMGWSTLVDAMRASGFAIVEAWPLSTEMRGGRKKVGRAMLASSIFLIARKRAASSKAGNYEMDVVPELGNIVRERVDTLWEMGISGADLVIACVGAGLRAFTKYAHVEYGNGEEVLAERFLAEVETVVLETVLGKLSKTIGSKNGQTTLAGLDPATRFYVLWRYTYGAAELDAGEAIIFANGTHVELDGQHGLTQSKRALVEKKKSKYRLHDYTERGAENALGQPAEDGTSAPAVDALHRLLWLVEHKPLKVPDFLNEAKPNVEQLRLVAQALGGPALSGGELSDVSSTAEQSAIGKLLANWSAVMVGKAAVEDRRTGQESLFKA